MERLRLFVALDLPAEARDALVAWRAPLLAAQPRLLRPVAPASLHVTLVFLGDRAAGEADAIGAAVTEAADDRRRHGDPDVRSSEGWAPGLALTGALWLPRRAPHVLAVGLDDARGGLAALQARVAAALAEGGWHRPEARPFLPHVTVARVRARGNEREVRELARTPLAAPPPLAFDGVAVTLYRSLLGAGGARYAALARVELR